MILPGWLIAFSMQPTMDACEPGASSGLISSPFTLRQHPFALHYSFSYMVHNSIS
jgi:hypothetical protein